MTGSQLFAKSARFFMDPHQSYALLCYAIRYIPNKNYDIVDMRLKSRFLHTRAFARSFGDPP